MTELQLALDVINLNHALKIVDASQPYFKRWEAGTPLIKAVGINILQSLRGKRAASRTEGIDIVADMKTLDGGAIESKLAIEAGADVVMVSGHASDSTIRHAIKTTHAYGKELMVELDTMLPNVIKRAKQVTAMRADCYEYHIGIDYRENGAHPGSRRNIRILKKLNDLNNLAVAGGMNPVRIFNLMQVVVPKVIVVGKAITEASDILTVSHKCAEAVCGIQ